MHLIETFVLALLPFFGRFLKVLFHCFSYACFLLVEYHDFVYVHM